MHIDEETTQEELAELVLDDYGLKDSTHQIQLSYMFSNKALKTMAHDTPPFYVSTTRQLNGVFKPKENRTDTSMCGDY